MKSQHEHPFKVIGTRPIRHDGVDKVTGRARYGADITLPGLLHGKVLRSPHPHARINQSIHPRRKPSQGSKRSLPEQTFLRLDRGCCKSERTLSIHATWLLTLWPAIQSCTTVTLWLQSRPSARILPRKHSRSLPWSTNRCPLSKTCLRPCVTLR